MTTLRNWDRAYEEGGYINVNSTGLCSAHLHIVNNRALSNCALGLSNALFLPHFYMNRGCSCIREQCGEHHAVVEHNRLNVRAALEGAAYRPEVFFQHLDLGARLSLLVRVLFVQVAHLRPRLLASLFGPFQLVLFPQPHTVRALTLRRLLPRHSEGLASCHRTLGRTRQAAGRSCVCALRTTQLYVHEPGP